jgi:hypothetical protein
MGHASCDNALEDVARDVTLANALKSIDGKRSNDAGRCRRDRTCKITGKQGAF